MDEGPPGRALGYEVVTDADVAVSRASSIKNFRRAVALLKQIDPSYSLYVASDTLCLMKGPSHDDCGRPRRDAILAHETTLRISGGDW
jgi:hypothetical protein